jgi:hypothetical protein
MALITWQEFSRRPEIKALPLHEQKKQFLWENQRRAEENWFLEMQVAGASGNGFSGIGIDGPIAGATVASSAGVTTTNALGEFTFTSTPVGPITITGGTDSITGLPFEGELVGYAEYKTISPITTVAHYIKEESSLTIDEAVTKVFASSSALFGIELPVESKDVVLQRDYIKESVVNNNRVGIAAQAVATYLEGVTETLGETLKRGSANVRDTSQFDGGKGKNRSYRAIGRQIALENRFNPSTLIERVKYNVADKQGNISEAEGVDVSNYSTISSQLTSLRNNLREKVDEQQYTANYLTTQIQSFNRAQKTTIKQEIADAINTVEYSFTDIEEARSNVEGDLKQIEAGKTNESEPVVDSKLVSYGAPVGAFSQKNIRGARVKFESGVFNDLSDVRSVVYFGSNLQGSTLYKTVESKLGVGYQTILMRVGEVSTTTTISANEYVEIQVTDENKNPFLITAKPQPLLEKSTAATLTAVSIAKREEEKIDHISGEGIYTIISGISELDVTRINNEETGKNELHWVEKAGSFILRETKGSDNVFEVGVKELPDIIATKLTFTDNEMSFSVIDEEALSGKRTYNVSYSAESDDNSSDVDHIQNSKRVQYSIAELVDGSYTKDTTDGVLRGGADAISGLAKLTITYFPFIFDITENYDPPAKGENAVGKEIFTITDISKEGGLGQLVNNATFVKDEGSTTERLIFSFDDIKGIKRTHRITYTVL